MENKSEKGAYTVNITSHESIVTLVASGTEVELALRVQDKLKENGIHSKVVSMLAWNFLISSLRNIVKIF